jgi:hypothetical protein
LTSPFSTPEPPRASIAGAPAERLEGGEAPSGLESSLGTPGVPEFGADYGDLRAPLRLTVTRGVLGLELYEPVEIGPLTVSALTLSLPGLKFPIDLSGGVPRFRHRRGELEHAGFRVDLDALGGWIAARTRDVWGGAERRSEIWQLPNGTGLGVGLFSCCSRQTLRTPASS